MKTKTCLMCKETLTVDHFYSYTRDGRPTIYYQPYCKPCRMERTRQREAGLAVKNQHRILDWYEEKGGCADCGETNPLKLSCDHVRGVKLGAVAKMARKSSPAEVEAELAKCEPRCHNCHQVKTAAEANWFGRDDLAEIRARLMKYEENKLAYAKWQGKSP